MLCLQSYALLGAMLIDGRFLSFRWMQDPRSVSRAGVRPKGQALIEVTFGKIGHFKRLVSMGLMEPCR